MPFAGVAQTDSALSAGWLRGHEHMVIAVLCCYTAEVVRRESKSLPVNQDASTGGQKRSGVAIDDMTDLIPEGLPTAVYTEDPLVEA
jgi:hypothetical protein